MKWRSAFIFSVAFILGCAEAAQATRYTVEIDTSTIKGSEGAIVFELTRNALSSNRVTILNFIHDGTTGLPETQGGLIQGDIILLLNPAPFTEIKDAFFFNELLVPFTSFGTSISFTLLLTENGASPSEIPHELSFFLLGADGLPLFASSDPLGADSLFTVCIDGTPSGLLSAFEPTVFTPPELLEIFVSGGGDGDGDGVPDGEDECPNSDRSATVVLGECDSGVPNPVSAAGCTLSDLVSQCAENAGNHGIFVSCVTHLTNDLRQEGSLTGQQEGAIQSCAAQADLP